MVPVCVTQDVQAGLDRGRSVVVNYAMHPAAARLFGQHGYAEVLGLVQERLHHGDRPGALRQVPDRNRGLRLTRDRRDLATATPSDDSLFSHPIVNLEISEVDRPGMDPSETNQCGMQGKCNAKVKIARNGGI